MTSRRKPLIPTDSAFVFTYLHFNTFSFISLRDVGNHRSTRIPILCKRKSCLTTCCHPVFLFYHTFTQTHYGYYTLFLCHFLLQYYIIVLNSLNLLFSFCISISVKIRSHNQNVFRRNENIRYSPAASIGV